MSAKDWRSWSLAKKILAKGALDGNSLLISAPTGTGKSYTATMIMIYLLMREHQGVSFYLVPLKALAEEAYERFKEEMPKAGLDTNGLAIATGDYDDPVDLASATLVVATYEKLLSLLKAGTIFSPYVVVADEFQIVADSQRGPRIEALMSMRFRGSNAVLFVLSAVVGNPEIIAKWLKVDLVRGDSCDRRVPLRIIGKKVREPSEFVRGQVASELDSVGKTQLLVFCYRKDTTETLAESLTEIVSPRLTANEKIALGELSRQLKSIGKFNSDLADMCEKGVAYHHSLLTKETRREVERAFRGTALKVICCTPTLAQGVNTPARVVIVRDINRFDSDVGQQLMPVSELLNMVGRAGRPSFEHEEGLAYVLSKKDVISLTEKLTAGKSEDLKSALGETFSNIAKFVLQAIRNTEGCDQDTILDQASSLLWAQENGMAGVKGGTTLSVESRLSENFESELERGQVGRIEMRRENSGRQFIQAMVKSTSNKDKVYRVRVYEGIYSCECTGYKSHRTICKHIRGVVAECLSGKGANNPAIRDFATLAAFECLRKPDIHLQIRYSLDLLKRWELIKEEGGMFKIRDFGESAARSYLPLNRLHALWEHMRGIGKVSSDKDFLGLVYADTEGITPDMVGPGILDSLQAWMDEEAPERIMSLGGYDKYQEFLNMRDNIVYALENCIDFANLTGRKELAGYLRNLRRRVWYGAKLDLIPLTALRIEGLSRTEARALFRAGVRDLEGLARASLAAVTGAVGERGAKIQPTAKEMRERLHDAEGDPQATRRVLSTYRVNWDDAEEYLGVRLEK